VQNTQIHHITVRDAGYGAKGGELFDVDHDDTHESEGIDRVSNYSY